MSQGLAYRKLGLRRPGGAAKTRQSALRSGSAIALCRALLCRALPGVFVGIGVFAIPDNPLGAVAGSRGAGPAHVRVSIDEVVPVKVRAKALRGGTFAGGRPDLPFPPLSRPDSQSLAEMIGEAGILGQKAVSISRGFDGQAPVTTRVQTVASVAPVQQQGASVPSASSTACAESAPGDGCAWSAAADVVAPAEIASSGGAGLSTFGADHVALLQPKIGFVPFSFDAGSEPLVNWSAGPPPANSRATTADLAPLMPHNVQILSLGFAQSSVPADEQPHPSLPERVATIPGAAMRSRDLEDVQISGSSPALSSLSEQIVSIGRQKASDVMQQGILQASGQAPQTQRQSFIAPVPLSSSGKDIGRSIMNAALGTGLAAAGIADAGDSLVFAITGEGPLATGSILTAPRLVRLRSLIEALHDRFEAQELERITASSAADAYLPIDRLQIAGIPLAGDLVDNDILSQRAMPGHATLGAATPQSFVAIGDDPPSGGLRTLGLDQSLSATASAGFDSNPFLAQGANPEAASMRLQLAPALSREGERSSFRLTGRLEHIEYFGKYASLQNFGADLAASRKLSERVEIDGGLTFRSDVLATNLGNPFGNEDLGVGSPVPPTGNDVTILGQGQRRTQYGLDGGVTLNLSQRDQLRWSVSGRADRFGSDALVDSNFLAQRLQYSRRLGEDFTIGAAIDANIIDFTGSGLEGAQTVSPQLQVNAALTPRLNLTASVGLAVTRLEFGGVEDTTTALAGDISLCRKGERSSFCLNGSRQVLPAAIGGALLQTSGGFSYSLQLSERDTVQLSGNYATASQPIATTVGDFESINGFVRYERRLNERMRIFASGGVLSTAGNLPTNVTNVQGLIGITMTVGQTR